MNIREDIKQLDLGPRNLRKFGLVVGGVFALLGVLFLFRHKPYWLWFLGPGAVLMALGAVLPRSLKYACVAWMSVAFVLGFVVAHVILTLFFYLVVLPIGLVARLAGKDFLSLKLDPQAPSYWIRREPKEPRLDDYERQF